jgi:hypothetical protein
MEGWAENWAVGRVMEMSWWSGYVNCGDESSSAGKLWYFRIPTKVFKVTGEGKASFKTYPSFMDEFKDLDLKAEQFRKLP